MLATVSSSSEIENHLIYPSFAPMSQGTEEEIDKFYNTLYNVKTPCKLQDYI